MTDKMIHYEVLANQIAGFLFGYLVTTYITVYLIENKKAYYAALENTTGYIQKESDTLDITLWCEWFLNTLYQSLLDAKGRLNHIVYKTQFWDKHRDQPLNARQIKVLNFILDIGIENFKGNLSKKKYMSIADTASTTASRDIAELLELGCIEQIEGTAGRNVSYRIVN
jgi:Fic family protein